MVDYSRFDKIGLSDDSSDEEIRGQPSVYKIDSGEQVTIPGRNVTINSAPRESAAIPTVPQTDAARLGPTSSDEPGIEIRSDLLPATAQDLCENGGVTDAYSWSQSKDVVVVSAFVPKGTRAKGISVSVRAKQVKVSSKELGEIITAVPWTEIEPPMDEDDLEWEVADVKGDPACRRVIRVTLHKSKRFGTGVVIWWKAAFKDHAEIDTTDIKSRRKGQGQTFSEAFKRAQESFKAKKLAEGDNRIEVDVSD